jgi:hypothetical protein
MRMAERGKRAEIEEGKRRWRREGGKERKGGRTDSRGQEVDFKLDSVRPGPSILPGLYLIFNSMGLEYSGILNRDPLT